MRDDVLYSREPLVPGDDTQKRFVTARAVYALNGFSLYRRCDNNGFRVILGAWSTDLDDLSAVAEFARLAGFHD